jgi:hypothetical protein
MDTEPVEWNMDNNAVSSIPTPIHFILLTLVVCGDAANVIAAGATLQPESGCNMVCPGNDSYLCGGPSRIQYYTWTGTPLTSWDFKTGTDAGQYQFLLGSSSPPPLVLLFSLLLTKARQMS